MSYYSCLPSLARKLLCVNLKIKCKKCGHCSKYKVQVPTCNPEAIASLTAPFTVPVSPSAPQNLIFTNIAVNESCYNPCNTCYRTPCCCKSKCDSSSSSCDSSSSSDSESCHKKKKKCHKKKKCKSSASFAPSNCCPPPYPGNGCCPPTYGNGCCPPTYGNGCPTPIAPSYCGGTPYYGLYNQTNGVFTIPPCGSGMYLFTASFTLSGITTGTVTFRLVVNGAATQFMNITINGTYYFVYRASLQESGTVSFDVVESAGADVITLGSSAEVIATRLY